MEFEDGPQGLLLESPRRNVLCVNLHLIGRRNCLTNLFTSMFLEEESAIETIKFVLWVAEAYTSDYTSRLYTEYLGI